MQENLIIEESWTKIFNILRRKKYIYVKNEARTKQFLTAVCWTMRNAARWRALPECFGKWNSVFKRFNEWTKNKVWDFLFEECVQDPDLEHVMIDSTFIKAHASSAGYRYKMPEAIGRSRGGFTTKVHALVDALGLPLRFIITGGNVSDISIDPTLCRSLFSTQVLADKGYDSDKFRNFLKQNECVPVIPGRSNRKTPVIYDKILYKERNGVERFFGKIKHFHRISMRHEKTARNYQALLNIVGALAWLQ
jgi:transposase